MLGQTGRLGNYEAGTYTIYLLGPWVPRRTGGQVWHLGLGDVVCGMAGA